MGKMKYRLKGHESFILRDGWLTKGINAVVSDNMLYRNNKGADALGVGTNMAKSIRYWMKTSGITKESSMKGVTLTELGTLIMQNDIYIEDIFTLWIIHSNITTNIENATSWNLFFNYMDLTTSFSRDEMQTVMKSLILRNTELTNPSERSIKDDCAAILSMYTRSSNSLDDPEDKRSSPFDELGLIKHENNQYIKKRPAYDKLNKLVILYLIIDRLNSERNLQIDDVTDGINMPGKILNLNRIAVNEYLDDLQNDGYIRVDRTAGLDTIYPGEKCIHLNRNEIVRAYYEGGI